MIAESTLNKNGIELMEIDEVFTQVKGYKYYFISNYGRLIHKNKKGNYNIVSPVLVKGGYLKYTLSKPTRKYKGDYVRDKNGKPKRNTKDATANQLVGMMFLEYNPYTEKYNYTIEQLDTHHKDHNPQNNYYKNLMWLSNGKKGSRPDHGFINTIKRIAVYDESTATYHRYRDIERLCGNIDIDILELIDILKDKNTPSIKDGEWTTYKVYEYYIGIQKFTRKPRK